MNFGLKNDMIQQVHNSCQFHGLPGDDANKHLDKLLHVTQSIKVNEVTDDALRLRNLHERRLEKCYDLIKNMTAHHNDWDTSAQQSESSGSITSSSDTEIVALKAEMAEINKNLMRVLQVNQQVKAVTQNCKTCGGLHSFFDCPATVGNTQNVYVAGAYQEPKQESRKSYSSREQQGRNQFFQGANQGQNQPPAYQAPAYQAPVYQALVHQPQIPQPQVVTTNEFTNFMKANDAILKNMQTNMTSLTNSNLELKNMFGQFTKMNTASSLGLGTLLSNTITNPKEDLKVVSSIIEPVASLVSAPRPNQRPLILYPSRLQDQKLRDKANDQREKFFQIFKDLNFNISFSDALILMPKFSMSIKSLLTNKDKLSLADLGASINLMPSSIWNKLSLPDLSPTSFLKTERALIDVFEGELTLRVGKEAITFNLEQTSRYLGNYNDMMANRIDVIDMAYEEYSQEVVDFSDMIASGNPTLYYDLIVSTTSLTLTPFENNDFLLEEVDAFLALEDDPTLSEVDQSYKLKICEAKSDKSSIDEPPKVKLKDLPPHIEYTFLDGDEKLPVIIVKDLSMEKKTALITVLKLHKRAVAWKLSDIKGIEPEFCTHKILMEEDFEQRYFQIPINPKDQEKTTFTCPYGTFAYHRMPFGLCNAPDTFQRCMMAIFPDMIEKTIKVFMDDFSVFRNSFQSCLSHLEKMLKRCEDTNLCLNWEKSHFMVKEGIVLGHKISKEGIEVDKAKVDVITKLPHPTTVKGIQSFLGHAGFYRRFIKDFLKIARVMTRLLKKDTPFIFSKECVEAFQTLKRKLTEALILIAPNWDMPFELMCDASHFAIGVVLGKCQEKHFRPIHYATGDHRKVQLNELNELRDQAYKNSLIYKEKTKRLHDSKIKDRVFNIGDRVLLFNSRLKIFFGKLKSRWSRPFIISHVFPYGTVELSQPDGPNFKVNGHRLKHYFVEDLPMMVVPDLQTFPKDH
uniref:Reverse transcriptase domain-containing protein n=1 Tax=Tanacetum cinerariifolium TaxID=118510 RepID=A0A6L2K334_TANCI|nr:reverse transcriptase domain-containing protein [Tanacetum cinerariifolium]